MADVLFSDDFFSALKDYYYLINRHYPERGTLKLSGDRYRLSRDQRTILYRGVTSDALAESRRKRLVKNIRDVLLIIDGYNVLFTILNYYLGRTVFIGNDGIVRDAGSLHGKLRDENLFLNSVDLLYSYLRENIPSAVLLLIDSPVSHSTRHQALLSSRLADYGIHGEVEMVKSADHLITGYREGIIATSDSAIIDNSVLDIVDLPRLILEKNFEVKLFDLGDFAGNDH